MCGREEHDGLVHLWWREDSTRDRLVQAYVNGDLVDATAQPSQRELWLLIDRSRPNRIELRSVPADASDALWIAPSDRVEYWTPPVTNLAEALVIRDESLPIDTQIEVAVDGRVVATGELWPGEVPRRGFGGLFGLGDFGQDAVSGWGLGRGELGFGPLGTDAAAWRWRDPDLSPGPHTITLTAKDLNGQKRSLQTALPLVVDALPDAALSLTAEPDFTLTWTD